jgi:hypothetical protein
LIELEGAGLRVSVLDPVADASRLGSRYVAGGYVWQVTDGQHGALLSGPQYPAEPPAFDGQGLPEVFETALGAAVARVGDDVHVIGVGRVRRESAVRPFHVRDNPTVIERAVWRVHATREGVLAETRGEFGEYAYALAREVTLTGRTVSSNTWLRSLGTQALPVRWFAHPFLPWSGDDVVRLSLESALPEGAALVENERGWLVQRPGVSWSAGHYILPRVALGAPLEWEQRHPLLGSVRVKCRFPLGGLALWGNERTLSVEPFLQTIVAPAEEWRWEVAYELG